MNPPHPMETPGPAGPDEPARVLVVAPVGRDAQLVAEALPQQEARGDVCPDVAALCARLDASVGALVVAGEALDQPGLDRLRRAFDEQPVWSRLPMLLLVDERAASRGIGVLLDALGPRHNVTVLERPLRRATFQTAVRFALNARREQRALERLLAEQDAAQETLERRLAERTREVQTLASALTMAEQRERSRISQLLHDHLQQLLCGIKLPARVLRTYVPDEQQHLLENIGEILDEAIDVTRTLTVQLSPPVLADDSLQTSFRWLTEQMRELHGLHVTLEARDALRSESQEVLVLLIHLVRELLFNVVKHAGVDEARLFVDEDATGGRFIVRVEDDGAGFDPALLEAREPGRAGFGLHSVRERLRFIGGRLDVASAPGGGTRVTLVAPRQLGHIGEGPPGEAVRHPLAPPRRVQPAG